MSRNRLYEARVLLISLDSLELRNCYFASSFVPSLFFGVRPSTLTVTTNALLQIANLGHGRVLTACAQQVAKVVELNTAITALVEQRERLLVVGRGLVVRVRSHNGRNDSNLLQRRGERKEPKVG